MYKAPLAHLFILTAFLANSCGSIPTAQAQDYRLPAPGVMVSLSPEFNPPILKGIKVHPDNPFRFDFILDKGGSQLINERIKDESSRLIKYFLASLTIPEKDLWVNLSPYEKDRIVPESFGQTEMGRDLLAEDYMLKQITASLIYPEGEVGKKFWKRVYQEASQKYGTTNIPVNTFNKVWIMPEKAIVYENAKAGTAYVVESKLKVMLEEDYLALDKSKSFPNVSIGDPGARFLTKTFGNDTNVSALGSQIIREIVIPELTKEVNAGKNFVQLRQAYNSLILASWYKKKIRDSILEQVYADKKKVAGISIDDPAETERIYQRYLHAFKKGVFNYIKEDTDILSQEAIPRKYFSGGFGATTFAETVLRTTESMDNAQLTDQTGLFNVAVDFAMAKGRATENLQTSDNSQLSDWKVKKNNFIKAFQDARFDFINEQAMDKMPEVFKKLQKGGFALHGMGTENERIMKILSTILDKELRPVQPRELEEMGLDAESGGEDSNIVFYFSSNLLMDDEVQNYGPDYVVIDPEIFKNKDYVTSYDVFSSMHDGKALLKVPNSYIYCYLVNNQKEKIFIRNALEEAQKSGLIKPEEMAQAFVKIVTPQEFLAGRLSVQKRKLQSPSQNLKEPLSDVTTLSSHAYYAKKENQGPWRLVVAIAHGVPVDGVKVSRALDWDVHRAVQNWGKDHVSLIFADDIYDFENNVPRRKFIRVADTPSADQWAAIEKVRQEILSGIENDHNLTLDKDHNPEFRVKSVSHWFEDRAMINPQWEEKDLLEHLNDINDPTLTSVREYLETFDNLKLEGFLSLISSLLDQGKIGPFAADQLFIILANIYREMPKLVSPQSIKVILRLNQKADEDRSDDFFLTLGSKSSKLFPGSLPVLTARARFDEVTNTFFEEKPLVKWMELPDPVERGAFLGKAGKVLTIARILGSAHYTNNQAVIKLLIRGLFSENKDELSNALAFFHGYIEPGVTDTPIIIDRLKQIVEDAGEFTQEEREEALGVLWYYSVNVDKEFLDSHPGEYTPKILEKNKVALDILEHALSPGANGPFERRNQSLSYLAVSINDYIEAGIKKRKRIAKDLLDLDDVCTFMVVYQQYHGESLSIPQAIDRIKDIIREVEKAFPVDSAQLAATDQAMVKDNKTGGIDLTPANMDLQTQHIGGEIKFHLDPAMLEQLKDAPGFVPVIISVQPIKSLPEFLGLNQPQSQEILS